MIDKPLTISDKTVKMMSELSSETKTRVRKMVRKHVAACAKFGSPIENLDRLLIEAVEVVRLERSHPELKLEYVKEYEPFRHYAQYTKPRVL
jgi:hypothetical protein